MTIFLSLGRLHAVQKGIKIDSKGKESKLFLLQLMDQLEKVWLVLWLYLEVWQAIYSIVTVVTAFHSRSRVPGSYQAFKLVVTF